MPYPAGRSSFDTMRPEAPSPVLKVVIVGAGVAGLETMMALRALAGPRVEITLVAPADEFVYRPLAVAEPFGVNQVRTYPLERIAAHFNATFVQDELAWVGVRTHRVFLRGGDELSYDALVMAMGAYPHPAWPHVPTFCGPRDVGMIRSLVEEIDRGDARSLGFVVPTGATWPLPIYELALQMASRARERRVDVELAIFTPEAAPLEVFGGEASGEIAKLLSEAGIELVSGARVEVTAHGELLLAGEEGGRRFDRVLALPRIDGPAPRGLPCDDDGFIPIDSHGLVHHVDHVYAAGDGTDYRVKQGGIATQQADAVAEVIAKRAGARIDPRPFRPVLRAHLMGDGSSRYLRGELHPRDGGVSEASESALWWPTGKIAGTYLSPYLAELDAGRSERAR
jgi:sulfide:quinone oxidoreductase